MINLDDIQELEENEGIRCDYNSKIVCPYCGNENESDPHYDNVNFDEAHVTECGKCEKHFMVTPAVTIDYSSEPIENHYLRSRRNIEKHIHDYMNEISREDKEDTEYHKWVLKYYIDELNKLNEEFERYFKDNEE